MKSDDRDEPTKDVGTGLLLLLLLLLFLFGQSLLLNLPFHSRHHNVLHLFLFSCLSDAHVFHVLCQWVARWHNKLQWLLLLLLLFVHIHQDTTT